MKTATFMMGGIAAGKTTVAKAFGPDDLHLDADQFKFERADFDPKNCSTEVHMYSMRRLGEAFDAAVAGDESFVMDGTGICVERMVSQIAAARENGFCVVLICVLTPLATCIARNAARDRVVDERVIRDKNRLVPFAFDAVKGYADDVIVVLNGGDEVEILGSGGRNMLATMKAEVA